ncbi:exosome complex component RRP41 homolog [Arachis hypogaea]|uniref:exosome complex component RRP41 homolog n=1 Tax=Arachis hypogaea TaxID=3818 RepID=UPI003B20E864
MVGAIGGTRSACINAATLALADAGIPMDDLTDLNYVEDSARGPDVIVEILLKLDKIDSKLSIDILKNVMKLTSKGCKAVTNYIREILLEHTKQLEYR